MCARPASRAVEGVGDAMEHVKVTREELYEQVWNTPVSKLAAQYGISDVGLAKTCARLGVPRPSRGYWAKLAAGEKVKRPPLPKPGPRQETCVFFAKVENPMPQMPRAAPPPVDVPETLANAHGAIRALAGLLKGAEVDGHSRLRLGPEHRPTVAVTVQAHRRALLVLDGLARIMTSRGHSVEVRGHGSETAICLQVQGEAMTVSVVEQLDPIPHSLTAEERRRSERGETRGIPKHDLVPGGRLQITIPDAVGGRCSWSDTKKHRVEAMLGHLVVAAEAEPACRAQIRVEEEERRREAELRRQEAEAERERQRQEEALKKLNVARAKDLRMRTDAYRFARDIRQYIGAMQKSIADAGLMVTNGGGVEEFMRWSLEYADEVDPLTRLREAIEETVRRGEKELLEASGDEEQDAEGTRLEPQDFDEDCDGPDSGGA